jgi:hypothetical protein
MSTKVGSAALPPLLGYGDPIDRQIEVFCSIAGVEMCDGRDSSPTVFDPIVARGSCRPSYSSFRGGREDAS